MEAVTPILPSAHSAQWMRQWAGAKSVLAVTPSEGTPKKKLYLPSMANADFMHKWAGAKDLTDADRAKLKEDTAEIAELDDDEMVPPPDT